MVQRTWVHHLLLLLFHGHKAKESRDSIDLDIVISLMEVIIVSFKIEDHTSWYILKHRKS